MATIFTRIIDGELPGTFLWRDDRCVVFLSINPLNPGHALVVPIEEIDHWLDAGDDLNAHLVTVAAHIGRAQMATLAPARIGLMLAGLEVPHLHYHVVPMNTVNDLDFANAAASVDPDDLAEMGRRLRAALREQGHDDQIPA